MPAPDAPLLAAGSVLGGRYRLAHRIASGGMADVWEGVDDVLTRAVAVKVLHPHLAADEAFQERFRREAIAAARLAHPAIVATFDAGVDGETTYIVMELVRGRTLRDLLKQHGPLPPSTAVAIGLQVAGALAHAHAANITHRDIKPSNILLCDEIAPGRVKVADFGIAKAIGPGEPDLTDTGTIIGTARYLAPEQVDGGTPDPRSDLYALGAVLFEILTGRPPFEGPTDLATTLAHLHEAPPKPRRLRPGIPRPLETITLTLLAKRPDDRYQTAEEVRRALEAVDVEPDDAEPLAVPDPTPRRGVSMPPRPARRSWVPAALVALVAAAVVAVAAVVVDSDDGSSPAAEGGDAVAIAAVRPFDPEGDGRENDAEAGLLIDGDTGTQWHTDRYKTRQFGGLKDGVGLILQLERPSTVRQLDVVATVDDWSAQVYVSRTLPRDLDGWGRPVAEMRSLSESAAFDLGDAQAAAVLLWITDPGPTRRAGIAEVSLRS